MVYLVFDLDATIANVASVMFILQDLTGFTWNSQEISMSNNYKTKLKTAYNLFVKKIANLERNLCTRIGILRPGILDVMKIAHNFYISGQCKGVIIYSNNSSIKCLEFIRDLIHESLDIVNLIKECIHRFHPIRMDISGFNPPIGNFTKTWHSLKNILVKGKCLADQSLQKSSVIFFDDILHPDLHINLGPNCIVIPPYNFDVNWAKVEEIYSATIHETDLVNFEFLEIVNKFSLNKKPKTLILTEHLYNYKMRYFLIAQDKNSKRVPEPDIAIYTMMSALRNKFNEVPENNSIQLRTYSMFC